MNEEQNKIVAEAADEITNRLLAWANAVGHVMPLPPTFDEVNGTIIQSAIEKATAESNRKLVIAQEAIKKCITKWMPDKEDWERYGNRNTYYICASYLKRAVGDLSALAEHDAKIRAESRAAHASEKWSREIQRLELALAESEQRYAALLAEKITAERASEHPLDEIARTGHLDGIHASDDLPLDEILRIYGSETMSPILERSLPIASHGTTRIITALVNALRISHASEDTKRMDELQRRVFTNREGEHELHFDFTMPTLREAIDATTQKEP